MCCFCNFWVFKAAKPTRSLVSQGTRFWRMFLENQEQVWLLSHTFSHPRSIAGTSPSARGTTKLKAVQDHVSIGRCAGGRGHNPWAPGSAPAPSQGGVTTEGGSVSFPWLYPLCLLLQVFKKAVWNLPVAFISEECPGPNMGVPTHKCGCCLGHSINRMKENLSGEKFLGSGRFYDSCPQNDPNPSPASGPTGQSGSEMSLSLSDSVLISDSDHTWKWSFHPCLTCPHPTLDGVSALCTVCSASDLGSY